MANGDTIIPFVIEEITGRNQIKVTLDQHDAPFGAPRKHEIFALGGENERHLIHLDGRQTPIIHTRYTMWEPAVIKGHLRDHFTAEDGHGRDIVEQLQNIAENQRMCRLTFAAWTWTVFPKKFRLPVEGLNDFTYELTFDVLVRPGYKPPKPLDHLLEPYPFDITAEIQAILAADRAALVTQQILVTAQVALLASFAAVDNALGDTMAAAQVFENAPTNSTVEARQMSSRAQQAKDQSVILSAILADATAHAILTAIDQGDVATFEAAVLDTSLDLDECQKRMRSLQYTANQRIRTMTTIYQVAPGDTLDSIATSQLGSAGRAQDLGVREQDLIPGRSIRIPS